MLLFVSVCVVFWYFCFVCRYHCMFFQSKVPAFQEVCLMLDDSLQAWWWLGSTPLSAMSYSLLYLY